MRSGQANASFHGAREIEFFICVSGPTVMGKCWKRCKRNGQDAEASAE
jgi:hypothetical protein